MRRTRSGRARSTFSRELRICKNLAFSESAAGATPSVSMLLFQATRAMVAAGQLPLTSSAAERTHAMQKCSLSCDHRDPLPTLSASPPGRPTGTPDRRAGRAAVRTPSAAARAATSGPWHGKVGPSEEMRVGTGDGWHGSESWHGRARAVRQGAEEGALARESGRQPMSGGQRTTEEGTGEGASASWAALSNDGGGDDMTVEGTGELATASWDALSNDGDGDIFQVGWEEVATASWDVLSNDGGGDIFQEGRGEGATASWAILPNGGGDVVAEEGTGEGAMASMAPTHEASALDYAGPTNFNMRPGTQAIAGEEWCMQYYGFDDKQHFRAALEYEVAFYSRNNYYVDSVDGTGTLQKFEHHGSKQYGKPRDVKEPKKLVGVVQRHQLLRKPSVKDLELPKGTQKKPPDGIRVGQRFRDKNGLIRQAVERKKKTGETSLVGSSAENFLPVVRHTFFRYASPGGNPRPATVPEEMEPREVWYEGQHDLIDKAKHHWTYSQQSDNAVVRFGSGVEDFWSSSEQSTLTTLDVHHPRDTKRARRSDDVLRIDAPGQGSEHRGVSGSNGKEEEEVEEAPPQLLVVAQEVEDDLKFSEHMSLEIEAIKEGGVDIFDIRLVSVSSREDFLRVLKEEGPQAKAVHVIGKSGDKHQGTAFLHWDDSDAVTFDDAEKAFSGLHLFSVVLNVCSSETLGLQLVKSGVAYQALFARGLLAHDVAVEAARGFYSSLGRGLTSDVLYAYTISHVRERVHADSDAETVLPTMAVRQNGSESWLKQYDVEELQARATNEDLPKWERKVALNTFDQITLHKEGNGGVRIHRFFNLKPHHRMLVDQVLEHRRIERNAIVVLPTGQGKTLIAGLALLDDVLRARQDPANAGSVRVVVVPSVALVFQQASALEQLGMRVARCCGSTAFNWSSIQDFDCVVATHGTFLNLAEENEAAILSHIRMVVFDECHHIAEGKHHFFKIMELVKDAGIFAVGLTATPGSGKGITEVRRKVDKLVERMGHADLLMVPRDRLRMQTFTDRLEIVEAWNPASVEREADACMQQRSPPLPKQLAEEVRKDIYECFEHQNGDCKVGLFELPSDLGWKFTPPVERLLKLLKERRNTDRVLVFVERKEEVRRLGKLLSEHPDTCQHSFGTIVGHSDQGWSSQLEVAKGFQFGRFNVLLATTAVQEGFDIPMCNHVIMLKQVTSSTQLVQSRGRARDDNSTYHVICTNPQTYEASRENVETVANVLEDMMFSNSDRNNRNDGGIPDLQGARFVRDDIGDQGCKSLAKALMGNQTLQTLSFVFTGEEGCKALAKALTLNQTLQQLGHVGNDFSERVTAGLRQAIHRNNLRKKMATWRALTWCVLALLSLQRDILKPGHSGFRRAERSFRNKQRKLDQDRQAQERWVRGASAAENDASMARNGERPASAGRSRGRPRSAQASRRPGDVAGLKLPKLGSARPSSAGKRRSSARKARQEDVLSRMEEMILELVSERRYIEAINLSKRLTDAVVEQHGTGSKRYQRVCELTLRQVVDLVDRNEESGSVEDVRVALELVQNAEALLDKDVRVRAESGSENCAEEGAWPLRQRDYLILLRASEASCHRRLESFQTAGEVALRCLKMARRRGRQVPSKGDKLLRRVREAEARCHVILCTLLSGREEHLGALKQAWSCIGILEDLQPAKAFLQTALDHLIVRSLGVSYYNIGAELEHVLLASTGDEEIVLQMLAGGDQDAAALSRKPRTWYKKAHRLAQRFPAAFTADVVTAFEQTLRASQPQPQRPKSAGRKRRKGKSSARSRGSGRPSSARSAASARVDVGTHDKSLMTQALLDKLSRESRQSAHELWAAFDALARNSDVAGPSIRRPQLAAFLQQWLSIQDTDQLVRLLDPKDTGRVALGVFPALLGVERDTQATKDGLVDFVLDVAMGKEQVLLDLVRQAEIDRLDHAHIQALLGSLGVELGSDEARLFHDLLDLETDRSLDRRRLQAALEHATQRAAESEAVLEQRRKEHEEHMGGDAVREKQAKEEEFDPEMVRNNNGALQELDKFDLGSLKGLAHLREEGAQRARTDRSIGLQMERMERNRRAKVSFRSIVEAPVPITVAGWRTLEAQVLRQSVTGGPQHDKTIKWPPMVRPEELRTLTAPSQDKKQAFDRVQAKLADALETCSASTTREARNVTWTAKLRALQTSQASSKQMESVEGAVSSVVAWATSHPLLVLLVLYVAFVLRQRSKPFPVVEGSRVRNLESMADFRALAEECKQSGAALVVDYYATWCPPCRAAAPIYGDMSKTYDEKDVVFAKVNVDAASDVAREHQIRAMPTFKIFDNERETWSMQGWRESDLRQQIVDVVNKNKTN
ncbi:Dicer-like protein 1 [Includes: Endoribonuclease dcl1 [Durusdinium trenchii]|uniref:Dicer-like protein 1 n=1 Tax=Durusdinium trenchii TaxID=1381693 RepID=A0ABP0PY76_9DINO